jgi:hypothetical protein
VCQTEDCAQLELGGGGGVEWRACDEERKNLELFPADLGGAFGVAILIVSWGIKTRNNKIKVSIDLCKLICAYKKMFTCHVLKLSSMANT